MIEPLTFPMSALRIPPQHDSKCGTKHRDALPVPKGPLCGCLPAVLFLLAGANSPLKNSLNIGKKLNKENNFFILRVTFWDTDAAFSATDYRLLLGFFYAAPKFFLL